VLLLFIGGDGTLGLTANQLNTGSPNFLARNRNHFAAEGFVVAVVDAASSITRPADAEALAQRFGASEKVQFKSLDGGSTPIPLPCDPLAPHGFFGIDQKASEAITRWIRGREE
jgi:hypothetical protein